MSLLNIEGQLGVLRVQAEIDPDRLLALEYGTEERGNSSGVPLFQRVEIDLDESGDVIIAEKLYRNGGQPRTGRGLQRVDHVLVDFGLGELESNQLNFP